MRKIIWKLRFAWYMYKHSRDVSFSFCYRYAESSIENDPDCMYEDGPIYFAQEEMANWSD